MTLRRITATPVDSNSATLEQLPNPEGTIPVIWLDDVTGVFYIGGQAIGTLSGAVVLAPLDNQTLLGGWTLVNEEGSFEVTNPSATPSGATLDIFMGGAGQGQIFYTLGNVTSRIIINPSGCISLQPPAGGANDGGHGVEIANSGLRVDGHFVDGVGLEISAGSFEIQGGGITTGNPVITAGSSGVEGVIKTIPPSGGGSYELRSPASAIDSVINQPIGTGTLALEVGVPASAAAAGVAGSIAYDASFLYVCTATNTWKRVGIASW